MNPDRIYQQHRDDALARQVTADEYSTFVAMPFGERFSYRSAEVFDQVICASAMRANEMNAAARKFACPKRVDKMAPVAADITEEIIVGILDSHIFLADLTFANQGVLIEVGAALGLKPTNQIILLVQGDLKDIHVDISHNRILQYDQRTVPEAVEKIAEALLAAAASFESQCSLYVSDVTRYLSPEATCCLNFYGRLRRDNPGRPSLYRGIVDQLYNRDPPIVPFPGVGSKEEAKAVLAEAIRELLGKRLLYTEYQIGAVADGDAFGVHATPLGWAVIKALWSDLAPTAPMTN
jgi:hypothetical protein